MVRDLLAWLTPPSDQPGRKRDYSRVIGIVVGIPAAWWLLDGLPFVYTVLAGLVALAVLLAWIL
jgi:hypothetical protein